MLLQSEHPRVSAWELLYSMPDLMSGLVYFVKYGPVKPLETVIKGYSNKVKLKESKKCINSR